MRTILSALLLSLPVVAGAADGTSCSARSGPVAPHVVELYTSEGCNSCPPADRWLATLQGRGDALALAFHVDYWDRLGWTDRYASPAWTRRQYAAAARNGSSFVYTPQVLLDGRDYRSWPALPAPAAAARAGLTLEREAAGYVVRVLRTPTTPRTLDGYWAVTEDGHRSQVRAGENAGATLQHEAVVRELQPVTAVGDAPLRFTPRTPAGTQPRRIVFVLTDASNGWPLQALALGC
jgi:hypothetical protein